MNESLPVAQASAPGKVILFGEHAVVYGEPAIAIPVTQLKAQAVVRPAPPGTGLELIASDLDKSIKLTTAPKEDPLAVAARLTLDHLSAPIPDATLTIQSTIPVASGLGSGAAVSTALVHALASFLGRSLPPAEVSKLVFEVEKIHHGTPSGIDNTVIAYEQPVYFVSSTTSGPTLLTVGAPLTVVIADTGLPSPTRELVSAVRESWESEPTRLEALFERIGDIARAARHQIESGEVSALGRLMDENHALLDKLGVSSETLNRLVKAARAGGALGAKLSGAGEGGNILALVEAATVDRVTWVLREAGAANVVRTTVT